MVIPREEAARALREAEAAADRSATAINYQRGSAYLLLWGVVWLAGNLAAFLRLPYGGIAFPSLMLLGILGSVALGLRAERDGRRRSYGLQSLVIALAFALFGIGTSVVLPSLSLATAEALIVLAIGAGYMVMGAFIGWRLSIIGAVLMGVVIGGYTLAREQFFLWLALAGGGGLILGGLWLRKA